MNYFRDYISVFHRRADAVAFIKGSEQYQNIYGKVLFYSVRRGVIVCAQITGLPKSDNLCENYVFAFHIHDGINCSGNLNKPFANAGTHYNPNDCPHPHHAGDLPPLFGVNGSAFSAFLTDRFSVPEIIGKTVIIHALPDDFTSQPAGNSGEKIACGVIIQSVR